MSISINIQQFNPLTFQLAQNEPVFITEHGKISNVVLSYEQYCQLNRQNLTIAEVFATPDAAADVAFELPKRADDFQLCK